jgi:hypothetical protein
MFRLFAVLLLLIVPKINAQDLSRQRMKIEKTFSLTVTTPFIPPKYETQVFATQDSQQIELFISCWNETAAKDVKSRVQCGRTWGTLCCSAWLGHQREDAPETYEFGWINPFNGAKESGLQVLTTTLVIVTNEHCVGAYVIKDTQAHGDMKLNATIECAARKP